MSEHDATTNETRDEEEIVEDVNDDDLDDVAGGVSFQPGGPGQE